MSNPPIDPRTLTPREFEDQVVAWLSEVAGGEITVSTREVMHGHDGDYEIDAVVRMVILGGAEITVLVECKRFARPVEREVLLGLHSKLRSLGAQKAMIFTTRGFQSGALEYAEKHGIACVAMAPGDTYYLTRSLASPPSLPPGWPQVVG